MIGQPAEEADADAGDEVVQRLKKLHTKAQAERAAKATKDVKGTTNSADNDGDKKRKKKKKTKKQKTEKAKAAEDGSAEPRDAADKEDSGDADNVNLGCLSWKRGKILTTFSPRLQTNAEQTEEAEETEENADLDMGAWLPMGLDDRLIRALRALKFESPTSIQAACIVPAVRDFRDILGAAETGSGKTLAFGIPILQHILHRREKVSVVVMEMCGGVGIAA